MPPDVEGKPCFRPTAGQCRRSGADQASRLSTTASTTAITCLPAHPTRTPPRLVATIDDTQKLRPLRTPGRRLRLFMDALEMTLAVLNRRKRTARICRRQPVWSDPSSSPSVGSPLGLSVDPETVCRRPGLGEVAASVSLQEGSSPVSEPCRHGVCRLAFLSRRSMIDSSYLLTATFDVDPSVIDETLESHHYRNHIGGASAIE